MVTTTTTASRKVPYRKMRKTGVETERQGEEERKKRKVMMGAGIWS